MLTFRNSKIAFLGIMIVLVIIGLNKSLPLYVYSIPIVAWVLLLAWGSYNIRSGLYMQVICEGPKETQQVALTFDDGPHYQLTPVILDILRKNNVQAAFFCIGKKMNEFPELVKRIDDEGHIVASHSFSHHFFFDFFTRKMMAEDLKRTKKSGLSILNKRLRYFRPPYGVTTPALAKAVNDNHMVSVGWSLRTYDTKMKDPSVLVEKIRKKVISGDIVLLHDTMKVTADALQSIIDVIKNKGLEPIRLDKLLNQVPYA